MLTLQVRRYRLLDLQSSVGASTPSYIAHFLRQILSTTINKIFFLHCSNRFFLIWNNKMMLYQRNIFVSITIRFNIIAMIFLSIIIGFGFYYSDIITVQLFVPHNTIIHYLIVWYIISKWPDKVLLLF